MIVLASSSPRRHLLMAKITDRFVIFNPNIDESSLQYNHNLLASELSKLKANAARLAYPDSIIVACDTIVAVDGDILGKPKNVDEAFDMLMRLSNRTHQVISGFTIITPYTSFTDSIISDVTFKKLTKNQIKDYVDEFLPLDKAGAYGIQDPGFSFVDNLKGSYDNVMGFPVKEIYEQMKKMNLLD